MSLSKLLVLTIVLSGDLLILLTNDVCLCTSALVLKCLLIVQLLFDLSPNGGGVDISEEWNEFLREKFIQSVCSLLEGQVLSFTSPLL